MTLNDIKKEALHLMFTNYSEILGDVDEIETEEYTQYLVNMNGCINRCIKRFEMADVLPVKTMEISMPSTDVRFFKTQLSGVNYIERLVYESDSTYVSSVPYELEGDKIVLPKKQEGKYILLYYPKTTLISYTTQASSTDLSNSTYGIPEELCQLIPYFIKAELFEEDEPELSAQARNIFEAMLNEYSINSIQNTKQVRVENVYGV